jgi:hypothetical protein
MQQRDASEQNREEELASLIKVSSLLLLISGSLSMLVLTVLQQWEDLDSQIQTNVERAIQSLQVCELQSFCRQK